jgi:UDP-glucose 4-epimerase
MSLHLEGTRLLITGGAGFVGARVVKRGLEAGATVSVLIREGTNLRRIETLDVVRLTGDVHDGDAVLAGFVEAKPDLVIHAAAWPDWRQDPERTLAMLQVHTLGTANILEAARKTRVKRVILLGSAGEYGNSSAPLAETDKARPVDPYSVSKLAATELALTYYRSFGVASTVVRPFVVYGPGEPDSRLFPSLFAAVRAGQTEAPFTSGEQVRDFVYVDDVAEGILRATATELAAGEVINLGTGVGTRVRDAVLAALEVSGGRLEPRFGALPYRPGEPPFLVANTTFCRDLLGWAPTTSLEGGLAKVWGAGPSP